MMKCFSALILAVVAVGCGGGSSTSLYVGGTWSVSVAESPGVVLPGGLLNAGDGAEVFPMTQSGQVISASFTDSAGNFVSIDGRGDCGGISGEWSLSQPGVAAAGKVYASNTDSNTVAVIDLETGLETATIPVGSEPRGLARTPDGSLVFVPNRFSNSVSVIDTATDLVTSTISLSGGAEPYACEVTPDGARVYVVNKSGNSASDVSVIDVTTLLETTVIPLTGTGPEGLAISPDGAFVYVINRSSATVDIISTASDTVVASGIDAPGSPRDAVFTPNGEKVYVVGEGGLAVLPGDGTVPGSVPMIPEASGRDVAVAADGARVYVAGGPWDATITAVDTSSDTIAGTANLSTGGAYGIDILGSATAYVSNDGNTIAIVDLSTLSETGTISLAGSSTKQLKVISSPGDASRILSGTLAGTAMVAPGGRVVTGEFRISDDSDGSANGISLEFRAVISR